MMTQTKEPVGGSTMELVNADRHGCVCVPTYSIATDAFHKDACYRYLFAEYSDEMFIL